MGARWFERHVIDDRTFPHTDSAASLEFQGLYKLKRDLKAVEKALKYTDWICNEEKMTKTNNGLFSHPMPVDRSNEVTDEVASGKRSIIIDIAENRLHVQKAVMALTMAQ